MLGPFMLLAASSMAGPDVRFVLDPDDYPSWAVRDQASTAAQVEFLIDPSGKIARCTTLQTLGSDRLGKEICGIVKRRRVGPATDPAGVKVYGFIRTVLSMYLPETDQGSMVHGSKPPPDAVLTVTQLPGGQKEVDAEVSLLVDENGTVGACVPASYEPHPEWAKAACAGKAMLGVRPILDPQGHPVRGIVNMKVRLTTSSEPPAASRQDRGDPATTASSISSAH